MPKLGLDRAAIAKIAQGVPQTISALERVFGDVAGFPSTIEEANALAGQALAAAQVSLSMLAVLADALAQLEGAPATVPHVDPDDTTPRAHLGTISGQNADQVEITGGTAGLDAGTAPLPSLYFGGDRASGLYRSSADVIALTVAGSQIANFAAGIFSVWGNVSASGQVVSNVATGTPPLVINSVTLVPNLYAARANYADSAGTAGHAGSADSLTSPSTFPAAASDLPTVIALANALRAAATSKGL